MTAAIRKLEQVEIVDREVDRAKILGHYCVKRRVAPPTASLATFPYFCCQNYAITHISYCLRLTVFPVAMSHILSNFFHLRSFFYCAFTKIT